MNTINGALFDFNGTLFFDSPLHVTAWDAISMELGAGHVTRTDLDTKFSGLPNKEILKLIVGGSQEPAFYDAYSRRKEAMYRKAALALPGGPQLTAGAPELFDYLRAHQVPFTIASASIKENIDFFMDAFHLDRWLREEDIVYDDGSYQDKLGMFLEAEKRIGIDAGALIFEDSLTGIRGGAAVPGSHLIVIESASLEDIYPQYPSILLKIHDFRDAMPLIRKLIP